MDEKTLFYIKVGGAAVLAIILAWLIVLMYASKSPPKIYFYHEGNLVTNGDVSAGSESIGDTSKEYVVPPRSVCKAKTSIRLRYDGNFYSFDFYPNDCNYKMIRYDITEEHIEKEEKPVKIKFEFFIEGTGQPLRGKLYFDGVLESNTQGSISISREKCASISDVVISTATGSNVTWSNSPSLCEGKDVIRFPVKAEDLT